MLKRKASAHARFAVHDNLLSLPNEREHDENTAIGVLYFPGNPGRACGGITDSEAGHVKEGIRKNGADVRDNASDEKGG